MISILKAAEKDYQLLAAIAKQSFIESHGSSASKEDINMYVAEKYNEPLLQAELADAENIYHIIYHNNQPAGYSKIIFNSPCPASEIQNLTRLDRLYLLQPFQGLKLGSALFDFNVALSKQQHQSGMWLFVWIENQPAIRFYKKNGFMVVGNHDFKITETHSNPNHQMLLQF